MTPTEEKRAKRHAMRHLTTERRFWESLGSIGIAVWAVWGLTGYGLGHRPLQWTGLEPDWNQSFLYSMFFASVLHWIGTLINGRWRFSPLLRAAGYLVMASALFTLALMSPYDRFSSATPTYFGWGVVYGIVLSRMWLDVWDAIRGRRDGKH